MPRTKYTPKRRIVRRRKTPMREYDEMLNLHQKRSPRTGRFVKSKEYCGCEYANPHQPHSPVTGRYIKRRSPRSPHKEYANPTQPHSPITGRYVKRRSPQREYANPRHDPITGKFVSKKSPKGRKPKEYQAGALALGLGLGVLGGAALASTARPRY